MNTEVRIAMSGQFRNFAMFWIYTYLKKSLLKLFSWKYILWIRSFWKLKMRDSYWGSTSGVNRSHLRCSNTNANADLHLVVFLDKLDLWYKEWYSWLISLDNFKQWGLKYSMLDILIQVWRRRYVQSAPPWLDQYHIFIHCEALGAVNTKYQKTDTEVFYQIQVRGKANLQPNLHYWYSKYLQKSWFKWSYKSENYKSREKKIKTQGKAWEKD